MVLGGIAPWESRTSPELIAGMSPAPLVRGSVAPVGMLRRCLSVLIVTAETTARSGSVAERDRRVGAPAPQLPGRPAVVRRHVVQVDGAPAPAGQRAVDEPR